MNYNFSKSQFGSSAWRIFLSLAFVSVLSAGALAQDKGGPPARGSEKFEAWLTKEVRHELVLLPYYSVFDNLEYRINGSEVTLSGQVVKPTLKDDAGNVVKRIEGVTKVVNNIEVLPLSNNDDRIRRAVFHAIYGDPMMERYALGSEQAIHIIVKNGNVTLEGIVDNDADKNVANIRANAVPGVFSVTNHLRVG